MMKCALERPECRKICNVCRNKSRNRRENLPSFRTCAVRPVFLLNCYEKNYATMFCLLHQIYVPTMAWTQSFMSNVLTMTWTQSVVSTFLSLIIMILMSAIIRPSCLSSLQSENICYHDHFEVDDKSKKIERRSN